MAGQRTCEVEEAGTEQLLPHAVLAASVAVAPLGARTELQFLPC